MEGCITTKYKIGLSFGIIILFVLSAVSPMTTGRNLRTSILRNDGNILYVGGSGEGNYTTIQSAIIDANSGDTVFVYDGIYYENVKIISKSINLIGKDKNLTIIDGNYTDYPIYISSSNYVKISGFTLINPEGDPYDDWQSVLIKIRNCQNTVIENNIVKQNNINYGDWSAGIYLKDSSNNSIRNNIICYTDMSNRSRGIMLDDGANQNNISNNEIYNFIDGICLDTNDNTIYGNFIYDNFWGLLIRNYADGNNIINNKITSNSCYGIQIRVGNNNFVSGNIISGNGIGWDNEMGLEIYGDGNYIINNLISNNNPIGISLDKGINYIIHNNIINNKQIGIYVCFTEENYISYNNFIDNGNYNACFEQLREDKFSVKWNKNYWNDNNGESYHIIPGYVYFIFTFGVKWYNFDWNPAKEPYDINETGTYDIEDYSRNINNPVFERFPLLERLFDVWR